MRRVLPSRRISELRQYWRVGRNSGPSNVVRAAVDIWPSTIEFPLSESLSLKRCVILEAAFFCPIREGSMIRGIETHLSSVSFVLTEKDIEVKG